MEHEVEGFVTRDQPGNKDLIRLHRTLVGLKKQLDRYSRLTSLAVEGRDLDAKQMLSRTGNPVPRLLESLTATKAVVESFPLQSHIQEAANLSRLHYHETLERALDESGLRRNGQWPSYVIEDVVRLELNLERYVALIDGKGAGSLEPTRLVDRIKARLNELFGRVARRCGVPRIIAECSGEGCSRPGPDSNRLRRHSQGLRGNSLPTQTRAVFGG